jgi:hypothetical protein
MPPKSTAPPPSNDGSLEQQESQSDINAQNEDKNNEKSKLLEKTSSPKYNNSPFYILQKLWSSLTSSVDTTIKSVKDKISLNTKGTVILNANVDDMTKTLNELSEDDFEQTNENTVDESKNSNTPILTN